MSMIRLRWIATGALLLAPAPGAAQVGNSVAQQRVPILREYLDLLAIPNIASDTANIRRNADRLLQMMAKRGLSPRLLEADDVAVPPAVYGEWLVPGATRTFVIYAHYDGQPVTPSDWKSTQPFVPVLRTARLDRPGKLIPLPAEGAAIDPEWRIYARSASDDKLGVMAILAAVDALRAQGQRPAFNVKIFLEGEEEAGSPNLRSVLTKHAATLKSDGWVIVDGPAHPSGARQVVLGVRGDVNLDIVVHGPARPLHSGHYGNWAPNPAMMLSRLLASMKDENGRVTITGFYDDVAPLGRAERQAIAVVPSADAQLREDLGLATTEGGGRSLLDLIHEPSLNINGIRSADVGEKARNVIPTTASATLDLRLVKGNDHKRQVARVIEHIKRQGFTVLDREPTMEERRRFAKIATAIPQSGYNAERTELAHPLAQSVIAAVKGSGDAVVLPTLGGSLPLYLLSETLGAPSVTLSLANHDNNQHAEDENLRIGNLWGAIETLAAVMRMK
ncbi:MAG TPA: M20/M25/M40 family metallo-hydrolase [Allosphingosinicella sp.]|jgi:acetylornithine deacetylase/succinyl-diaminopimelate desuccinylase-like protein|uniref:M20/M25/M40 family metallo-hydrolase n=1 Tax=Allosphingosinicella sp. TaxID=2823234 RepID=UPI002F28897D